jgi:phage gp37-like protein
VGLSDEFATHGDTVRRWQFFTSRNVLSEQRASLKEVVAALRGFLLPAIPLAGGSNTGVTLWPGGPWRR